MSHNSPRRPNDIVPFEIIPISHRNYQNGLRERVHPGKLEAYKMPLVTVRLRYKGQVLNTLHRTAEFPARIKAIQEDSLGLRSKVWMQALSQDLEPVTDSDSDALVIRSDLYEGTMLGFTPMLKATGHCAIEGYLRAYDADDPSYIQQLLDNGSASDQI